MDVDSSDYSTTSSSGGSFNLFHAGSPMSWRASSLSARSFRSLHGSPMSWRAGPFPDELLPNAEEVLTRNFSCCGLHLEDMHALLEHFEEVHMLDSAATAEIEVPFNPQHVGITNHNSHISTPPPLDHQAYFATDEMEVEPDADDSIPSPPAYILPLSLAPSSLQTSNKPALSSLRLSKPFRCPKPNCIKSYKQANGLKYHITHGSCSFARQKDLEHVKQLLERKRREREASHSAQGVLNNAEITEIEEKQEKLKRPFACGVGDCEGRYKSMSGLICHYQELDHGVMGLPLLAEGRDEFSVDNNANTSLNLSSKVDGADVGKERDKPDEHERRRESGPTDSGAANDVHQDAGLSSTQQEQLQSTAHQAQFSDAQPSEHLQKKLGALATQAMHLQPQPDRPHLEGVIVRLTEVFNDIPRYKKLLGSCGAQAQLLLDTFQMLLDSNSSNADFKRNLLVATQRLSRSAGLYPACYNLEDIELESDHTVAAGGFADIYKGNLSGQDVCLKAIRLYQTSDADLFFKRFSTEAVLWAQLCHPNMLPMCGLYRYKGRPCLVSPWMEYGDIKKYLLQHPEANRSLLVSDIASGVAYLHDNDIVHGDLKGVNILIDSSGRACLADFGLSAVSDGGILHWTSHSSAASKGGSVRWQAPELFDEGTDEVVHNSKATDVYAVACVAYEVFTGNLPFFEHPRDAAVIVKIKEGARPLRPSASSPAWGSWGLTENTWSTIESGWSRDPICRPSIHEIVAHFKAQAPPDCRPALDGKSIPSIRFRDSCAKLPPIGDVVSLLDGLN